MITRRHALALTGATLLTVDARAQGAWSPARPISIVVPYSPGGSTEVVGRLVAQEMSRDLGSAVVIENVPGGGGSIGSKRVATGPADGTSLVLATNQTHATNISLLPDGGGYDPEKDFAPIAGFADIQHVLVVRSDVPARSVAELVTLLRARPGSLSCASSGQGSASHLALEMFRVSTGADMVHVPYRGSGPIINDLLGGHVHASFITLPNVLMQVRAGQIRALAVASPSRCPHLPDLPTMAEAGVRNVEADAWTGLFAPAATPAPILARLRSSALAAMAPEAVRTRIGEVGLTVNVRDADALATFLRADIARWAAVIRAANVKPE